MRSWLMLLLWPPGPRKIASLFLEGAQNFCTRGRWRSRLNFPAFCLEKLIRPFSLSGNICRFCPAKSAAPGNFCRALFCPARAPAGKIFLAAGKSMFSER
jgi:hypothetical protein